MKLATLCYLKHKGETLMIHRIKKPNDINAGKWNGLGGKFLPAETPEDCVIREFYEESGLKLYQPQLKGFISFPGFAQDEDWYVFVFIANNFTGELNENDEGVLAWVNDKDIQHLNLWDGDRIFLPWLEQEGFFSARFVYKDGCFVKHDVMFYK